MNEKNQNHENHENLKGNTGRLQTRYRDADYEKWARQVRGIQRKETIREKVNSKIKCTETAQSFEIPFHQLQESD